MSSSENESRLDGVAIIGMAGKFPGAPDLETFWANVVAGKDTITHFTRAELEARNSAALEFGPDYVPAHGVLENAEMFDAGFFGFSPRDADHLDPQHRLFLEACWNALEDGGYDPGQYPGQIGVWGGCSLNTYLLANIAANREYLDELTGNYQVGEFSVALGNDKDFLCTRAAYKLNLRGPCMTVQSACATSLVAISQACQSLLTYQCDMALAGGVSVTFPQHRGYIYQEGSMGSQDGRCRPFDADATGTVFGHGVGVVLLKRLEDAVTDGDRIDAVIRGFAVNNDGAAKVGYMAPGVDGQSAVIEAAQAMAGISADEISYIEAHGTATPLGDPVEVAALTQAFRRTTDKSGYCALGSTKANIGHLDAAAGVSGLIKTVLAMKHGVIPPVGNFRKANPRIDFPSTPFFVNAESMAWQPDGPRIAGVSAFGVGGVNAHIVLEEAPKPSPREVARPQKHAQVLCVSARSEAALDTALRNLGEHLKSHPDDNLEDVAYTLQAGRHAFEHRASLVCSSTEEAARLLSEAGNRRIHKSKAAAKREPVFLFSGQGTQFPGMGQKLYETQAVYRAQIDACAEVLLPLLGVDLRQVLFPADRNSAAAAEALTETRIAQPALFVTELAMAALWREWGVEPKAMTGHSLGEFTAAVVAGVMSREDGLRLVAKRGQLMQAMERGAMLSVRAGEEKVSALLDERLSIAAVNSPTLCVVSGPVDAVEAMEKRLDGASIAHKRLLTSHAFHSAMMEPMLDEFEQEVRKISLRAPAIPYVSGVSGTWITAAEATSAAYWREHCRKAVRFADAAAVLLAMADAVLIEVGPGQALTTLAHQQQGEKKVPVIASMPERTAEAIGSETMLQALGNLWECGFPVDWKKHWGDEPRLRIALPTYPFERKKHWVEPPPLQLEAVQASLDSVASVTAVPAPSQVDSTPTQRELDMSANGTLTERKGRLAQAVAAMLEELSGIATGPEAFETPFMELGFDSLFLTQVSQSVQKKFGVKVTFRNIVEQFSTVAALAGHLDEKMPADAFAAEKPAVAAPVQASVAAVPMTMPAMAGMPGVAGTGVEELMKAQMQAMTQLFAQQLAALQGAAPVAPAAIAAPKAVVPQAQAQAPAPAAASHAHAKDFKAYGRFKPVQAGSKDGISTQQKQYIDALVARYVRRTPQSKEYTRIHRSHLADPRAVSGFRSLWKEMVYPVVANRSKGSRIWDLDGNEYIDIVNGFGAIMFGHGPDFVSEAVHKQIDLGVEIGPQSSAAGEVAQMICELTGMQRAAFCNTGSEAVMAALRVARTVTARDKIVYFTGDYHGTFDEVLLRATHTGATPIAPGIVAESASNAVVLEYGSDAALEYIRTHAQEIAAVLVEPIQSRHPEIQPKQFLHELRKITQDAGTALIFDEVVTGFRVALGGAQEYYGIRADLATYGKVIGGGYPIGVLAGKAEYLDALDGGAWNYGDDSAPEVGMTFFAGTFVRHPLAMAAAKAVLHYLKDAGPSLQQNLAKRVAKAAKEVEAGFHAAGLEIPVNPCGSWFTFNLPTEARFGSLLYYQMREKGIHVLEGYPCFFTTSHSDEDIAQVVAKFSECAAEMRQGDMLPTFVSTDEPAHEDLYHAARPEIPATVPMTESQREIWLAVTRGDDANCAFNESLTFFLRGPAKEEDVLHAMEAALGRHDALRSVVDASGEFLKIAPKLDLKIPYVDLSALSPEEQKTFLDARVAEEAQIPFDLINGPLIRATLFRTGAEELELLLTGHHIVLDGWSSNQLLEDAGRIYSAGGVLSKAGLAPLMPFSSYALEEQEKEAAGANAENERYWVEKFATRVPVLDLPIDRPRPALKSYRGETLRIELDPALYRDLKKTSAKLGCTLYVTLLSAYQMLLHRLTGQDEVVVGISAAGQSPYSDAALVGHCVHFLPMLSQLPEGLTAKEHITATRKSLLDAQDHQEFTYGTLLRKLPITRDPSRLPLIEVQFNLEKLGTSVHFEGLQTEIRSNPKAFVNTDMFLNVVEGAETLLLNCDYNTDLIDESTLKRWMECLSMVLRSVVENPERAVADLDVLVESERHLVLEDWNKTAIDFGAFEPVHRMIERQAEAWPDRIAVVCQEEEWDFQKLNESSNRIARHLRRQGITEGSLVAVCLNRSNRMLAALLGVLKAGGGYLPLDPRNPSKHIETVVEDADVALLVTEEDIAARLQTKVRTVCLDSEQQLWERESGANLQVEVGPNALAYVIYTSGSTGRPKGVAIEHAALTNLLRSMEREPGLHSNDILVSVTTISFDIAALEMFLPPMVGARLVIATSEQAHDGFNLLKLLERSHATVLQATPVTWRMLQEAGWTGQPRLKVMCGGEALPRDLANFLLSSSDEVWNVYGPTETTIWSSATKLEKQSGPVPVGPPIANTQFYILDDRRKPVPVGVVGELYIGGAGLARGYWNRVELTAEKFLPNPFAPGRMYRAGDLARWIGGGQLEILGRTDYQVKVRGFRIELGEIETALSSHPAVRDAVVVAVSDGHGDMRLAAWVDCVQSPAPRELDVELRALLVEKLPDYMIPAAISVLPALPRTSNGKIDRKALPAPQFAAKARTKTFTPAETPQQKKLAQIWAEVLKLDSVSITDSIFELGADSLLVFRIATRANREGLPIEAAQIFQHRTIASLSDALAGAEAEAPNSLSTNSPIVAVPRAKFRRTKSDGNY